MGSKSGPIEKPIITQWSSSSSKELNPLGHTHFHLLGLAFATAAKKERERAVADEPWLPHLYLYPHQISSLFPFPNQNLAYFLDPISHLCHLPRQTPSHPKGPLFFSTRYKKTEQKTPRFGEFMQPQMNLY